jgi:hypothetical protein
MMRLYTMVSRLPLRGVTGRPFRSGRSRRMPDKHRDHCKMQIMIPALVTPSTDEVNSQYLDADVLELTVRSMMT